MTSRTFAFAPLGAFLMATFLAAALSAPAAATDVAFTDFEGAWVATTTYKPGAVVIFDGSSYVCITQNIHIRPPGHTHDWAILGTSGFGSDSVTYKTGSSGATCDLGTLLLSASNIHPGGYVPADGTLLSISQNMALFQLLGTTYGGDGSSTFAVPDLRSVAPNNTIYLICVNGYFP
jgi:hypothetical protein